MNKESVSPACKDTTGNSYSFQIHVYLGTSIEDDGGMETEITNLMGAGWSNWKKRSGVLSINFYMGGTMWHVLQ